LKILEKAYLKARNSAAGLTNFCEEGAGVRRCEKELEEAEALFREYQASQPAVQADKLFDVIYREPNIQIHFIDNKTNQIILRKLSSHAPRLGDEIRFGGKGNEKFYKVIHVVWAYDEDNCPVDRVNIGVTDCT